MRKKVTVVGAGNVGANCAVKIADKELADVVLVDVVEGVPQGKGSTCCSPGPLKGTTSESRARTTTTNGEFGYRRHHCRDSRKPGMSRDDLLMANYEVDQDRDRAGGKYSPNASLMLVTNPLDAMCWTAFKVSRFRENRVIGMAGVSRYARVSGRSSRRN